MSARVLNPAMFSELYKIRSPSTSVRRNLPCSTKLNRIKKDLFGPVNPVETKKIYHEEIEKQHEKACSKWGFDFRSGSPLINSNQYAWERVAFPEIIPEMYTLTRAAHMRATGDNTSSEDEEMPNSDMLIDERAAKENASIIKDMISALEGDSMVFKVPSGSSTGVLACHKSLGKRQRQRQITEYMKERKRLTQTPKKVSPAKRQRTSSGSSSINSHFSPSHSQRNSLFSSHGVSLAKK